MTVNLRTALLTNRPLCCLNRSDCIVCMSDRQPKTANGPYCEGAPIVVTRPCGLGLTGHNVSKHPSQKGSVWSCDCLVGLYLLPIRWQLPSVIALLSSGQCETLYLSSESSRCGWERALASVCLCMLPMFWGLQCSLPCAA